MRKIAITLLALIGCVANVVLNWGLDFASQFCISDSPDWVCEHKSSAAVQIPTAFFVFAMPLIAIAGMVWAVRSQRWLPVLLVLATLPVSLLLWIVWSELLP